MSYTSESVFFKGTTLLRVREVIGLLGYQKVGDGLKVPGRTDSMMWYDDTDYRSWSGVELDIYRSKKGKVTVDTRTPIARSYWDLTHQNRTLKLLRDLLGGHFETDAGRNRYWRPEGKPPPPVSSGCYMARWRFHNSLIKPLIYLGRRNIEGQNAGQEPTRHGFIDELNPRLFSNNLLLPYLIAVWEDYFKSSFIALLRYSKQREAALKRATLTQRQLEAIAAKRQTVEEALAETLSFQRPSVIAKNFKLIDPKLDVAGAMRKPYRRRKTSLLDSIEASVEYRNAFVHEARMDTSLTEKKLNTLTKDLEVAIDRAYDLFASHYKFEALQCYR